MLPATILVKYNFDVAIISNPDGSGDFGWPVPPTLIKSFAFPLRWASIVFDSFLGKNTWRLHLGFPLSILWFEGIFACPPSRLYLLTFSCPASSSNLAPACSTDTIGFTPAKCSKPSAIRSPATWSPSRTARTGCSAAPSTIRCPRSWPDASAAGGRIWTPIFFRRRIAQAIAYRQRRGIDPRLCRLVWSESDGLPGVIVDRYGDHLVLQTPHGGDGPAESSPCRNARRAACSRHGDRAQRRAGSTCRGHGVEHRPSLRPRSARRGRVRDRRSAVRTRPARRTEDRLLPRSGG